MTDPIERERKFLVARLPDLCDARAEGVRQGYLTVEGDSVEMRLRHKGEKYFITLKSGAGLERHEREAEISREAFCQLWPATSGRRVEKTRWTGRLPGGLCYELDIFEGALSGLKLVEVEFESRDQAQGFEPPEWFGCDVTDDKGYTNASLAVKCLPKETFQCPCSPNETKGLDPT